METEHLEKGTCTNKHCSGPEENISVIMNVDNHHIKYWRGHNDCGGYFSKKIGYFITLEFKIWGGSA